MRLVLRLTFVASALLVGYGCGGSSSSPTGPSAGTSIFLGTYAAVKGQSGTLAVSVQAKVARALPLPFRLLVPTLHAQSVSATGNLSQIGGGTASLTGTYDPNSKGLVLSGGGYSVSGTLGGTTVTGGLTVPSGQVGAFTTVSTSSGDVVRYCGTQSTPSGEIVSFLVAVTPNGAMSGTFSAGNSAGTITGQQTGTNFNTTYVTTKGDFINDTGKSSGTIANGMLNGVDKNGNPFSASTLACGVAATIGGNPNPQVHRDPDREYRPAGTVSAQDEFLHAPVRRLRGVDLAG